MADNGPNTVTFERRNGVNAKRYKGKMVGRLGLELRTKALKGVLACRKSLI